MIPTVSYQTVIDLHMGPLMDLTISQQLKAEVIIGIYFQKLRY